jgi:CBS-domain-containing membrane protein
VLINVLIILAVAVLFNALFHWRRYPVYFTKNKKQVESSMPERRAPISHENFVYALRAPLIIDCGLCVT